MSPLAYVVLALLVALAISVMVAIHLLDRLDGSGQYQPTRRQRRMWRDERLELPRAVANRRRA